jgi:DNA-binding CsgD family transcriptional regulator
VKVVVKLYGASLFVSKLEKQAFYKCPDNNLFSIFQPNSDFIRSAHLKEIEKKFSGSNNIICVNLIFDEKYSGKKPYTRKIDSQVVTKIGSAHLENLVKFHNYVFNVILADLNINEEIWIPHQQLLTPRQIEILYYVYNGLSSKQIAKKLNLSPRTIELHRQNGIVMIGGLTPKKLELFFSPIIAKAFLAILQ